MICPTCRGRGFVPAGQVDDDLTLMHPCPECLGSGQASCCDAAGSAYAASDDDEDDEEP